MKTITLRAVDLKCIAARLYEWAGCDEEAHIIVECGISVRLANGGYIYTGGGNINTRGGNIYTGGGHIDTGGGHINTGGGHIDTGGGYLSCGILFWDRMAMPDVGTGLLTVGKVWPSEQSRAYWEERLGMKLEGCYADIERQLAPRLKTLLRRKMWTPTERWILESHLPKDGE